MADINFRIGGDIQISLDGKHINYEPRSILVKYTTTSTPIDFYDQPVFHVVTGRSTEIYFDCHDDFPWSLESKLVLTLPPSPTGERETREYEGRLTVVKRGAEEWYPLSPVPHRYKFESEGVPPQIEERLARGGGSVVLSENQYMELFL